MLKEAGFDTVSRNPLFIGSGLETEEIDPDVYHLILYEVCRNPLFIGSGLETENGQLWQEFIDTAPS